MTTSGAAEYASLDRFGLVDGQTYEARLFYANRGNDSKFEFRMNEFLTPGKLLGAVSGGGD